MAETPPLAYWVVDIFNFRLVLPLRYPQTIQQVGSKLAADYYCVDLSICDDRNKLDGGTYVGSSDACCPIPIRSFTTPDVRFGTRHTTHVHTIIPFFGAPKNSETRTHHNKCAHSPTKLRPIQWSIPNPRGDIDKQSITGLADVGLIGKFEAMVEIWALP
jgi:hypothetical protein